jgi:Cu2+-exporting ATPase
VFESTLIFKQMSSSCLHCGDPVPAKSAGGDDFCCSGCKGAYGLINSLGLKSYYDRRTIDPDAKILRPDEDDVKIDYHAHVIKDDETGLSTLYLMVEGIHCAACVWLIETVLSRTSGVVQARVNMSTRRLVLKWQGDKVDVNDLTQSVLALGYRLVPYDPCLLNTQNQHKEKELLRALSVAGFATANVMLFSVSVWAGYAQGMMDSTRDLMHWLSALVALPAIVYAGRPFFRSALTAIRAGRTNMDVPISLAVLLAAAMSLFQVINGEDHAYFDSAVSLLFFLLIGRYLDQRARSRARGAAEHLLGLQAVAVTVMNEDGSQSLLPPEQVREGMHVLCSAGERISIDGTVIAGRSDVDNSLITGESVPIEAAKGDQVFAGTNNLSGALTIEVTARGESTLLAEIVRLMEEAEAGRAQYVAVADRVAHMYGPIVNILSLTTFVYWFFFTDVVWQEALLNAIAVLIITCPCALALAVPVVQVIASARLMGQGILVKSATALERLAGVRHVVFDKTGTLTIGRPELVNRNQIKDDDFNLAASMAANSKHPLSRALYRVAGSIKPLGDVTEIPGKGLQAGGIKLGSRDWCGDKTAPLSNGPELWLSVEGHAPVCFQFEDRLKPDCVDVVQTLSRSYGVHLLSGDRKNVVEKTAQDLGITNVYGELSPSGKCEKLADLDQTLMVGDGLNDAPALAAAHVSLSPSTAIDVSQNTADCVFQGDKLKPVLETLMVAKKADRLIKQNFTLAFLYNVITVPIAMAGYVTPLIAAIAMSTSSLVVIANALRLAKGR